jgi:acyl carrier protein
MTREEILADLAVIFEVKGLTGPESLLSLESWDSITAMSVISMAAEKYGARISGDDLAKCKIVGDLVTVCGHGR